MSNGITEIKGLFVYVIKLQDDRVALPTINTWMRFQILSDEFLTRDPISLNSVSYILATFLASPVVGMFNFALAIAAIGLPAVLPLKSKIKVLERLFGLTFRAEFHHCILLSPLDKPSSGTLRATKLRYAPIW